MPSFDVVSELECPRSRQRGGPGEPRAAQRFDFKDTGARSSYRNSLVTLKAQVEFQLKQMLDILKLRLVEARHRCALHRHQGSYDQARRGDPGSRAAHRHRSGHRQENRSSSSRIRSSRCRRSIQGDKVRVTGKQRDDLQAAMALLRKSKLEVPLQFNNFRD